MTKEEKREFLDQSINSIILGDCIETMRKLPDNCIDLIYADPPYNLKVTESRIDRRGSKYKRPYYGLQGEEWDHMTHSQYKSFNKIWLRECYRILAPHGTIWISCMTQCMYMLGYLMQCIGFRIVQDVIWHKIDAMPPQTGVRIAPVHENIIMARKTKRVAMKFNSNSAREMVLAGYVKGTNKPKQVESIISIPITRGAERLRWENGIRIHPCQKPEQLLHIILVMGTSPNNLVLDPFNGVGTTATVAKRLHRRYIGIEKEQKFYDVTMNRLSKVVPRALDKIEASEYDLNDALYKQKYDGLFAPTI